MKASIVDLRTNMRSIGHALSRCEDVLIYSHGKPFAVLSSVKPEKKGRKKTGEIMQHPFFGAATDHDKTVLEVLDTLRGPRY